MAVFFDVGANNGSWSVNLARNNPHFKVFAFEPTPRMCDIIKSAVVNLSNYRLIEKAVSDFEGQAEFKVAGHADWGCSSLLDFSDKSKTEWPGRTDFNVTEVISVDVIRLENFIVQEGIAEVEYLHVDTQGSDLKVLMGMGDMISVVKKGEIEAATKEDILYTGQNTQDQCIEFLTNKGFKIDRIWHNDHYGNEINIEFSRI